MQQFLYFFPLPHGQGSLRLVMKQLLCSRQNAIYTQSEQYHTAGAGATAPFYIRFFGVPDGRLTCPMGRSAYLFLAIPSSLICLERKERGRLPLDKHAAALLQQLAAQGGPALNELDPPAARAASSQLRALNGEPEPVASIVNRSIPGPAGDIPVRIYTPKGSGPFPILMYFHGGGWVIGSPDTVETTCTMLANRAGAVVVSVDYRLAPEHKFPAAVEDCYAATLWAAQNAREINGDAARLAVSGDSAGGNLSAVVSLLARDQGGPKLAFQVLVYPVTDFNLETESYRQNGEHYFLTTAMMKWFWNHYIRTEADGQDWRASPLRAEDLSNLPPAFVVTAEFDPLRDEGEAYAHRLLSSGNTVTLKRYAGQIHGFFTMPGAMPAGRQAIEDAAALLRQAFARR